MKKLVFRENSFESRSHDRLSCSDSYSSVVEEDWFKSIRLTSVQWILKMRDYFHFSSKTAYLAVVYFDRFFMRRQIIDKGKLWAIRLLSVACLSLAAKLEEYRVPALSDYQIDGYEFNSKAIQRMELLVLSTLEWRLSSVTPFDYLSYFTYKFQCEHEKKDFLHNAVRYIFALTEVINVVDYRPSTIAAAALLAASSERYTKELLESKISSSSLCGSLEKDHVYACYSIMTAESSKNLKRTKRGAPSDLSANHSSIGDAIDLADSASFTGLREKRRRLQVPNIQ
ncbi:cyclin-D5-1 [Cocos nucifera]|nr:cyclin-D5-1 [Cocos nucifera]